jgi:hypothetical protein
MKFRDLLLEILKESNIIDISDETMNVVKYIYKYISDNLDKIKNSSSTSYDNARVDKRLSEVIRIKDKKGKEIRVSIAFYNDPESKEDARAIPNLDLILINLSNFSNDLNSFLDTMEHELIHCVDPKFKGSSTYTHKEKKDIDKGLSGVDYANYAKSLHEFDAFSAPIINRLKRKRDMTSREVFKTSILRLMHTIGQGKSVEEIIKDNKNHFAFRYFTDYEMKMSNMNKIINDFNQAVTLMVAWATNKTLWRKFLSRLSKVL